MSRRFLFVCLLAALLPALSACDGTTETVQPGRITGSVIVEGDPVSGVEVRLDGPATATATTDGAGGFLFQGIEPGSYQVTLGGWPEEVTFSQTSRSVSVEAGGAASVSFTGDYVRNATVRGSVRVDGTGVEDATVSLEGPDSRQGTTDAQGDFAFTQLRPGQYAVSVSNVGSDVELDAAEKSVEVSLGGEVAVTFTGDRIVPAGVGLSYIERPNSSLRMNLEDIHGEVDVVANVSPGTKTVTEVRVYILDRLAGTRSFPEGLTEAGNVEIRVNTAAFVEETGEPLYDNGPATVRVEVDTQEDGAAAASATLDIVLDNISQIAGVRGVSSANGEGVVANGRRWFGNRDLSFEVIPVLYDPDQTLGAITLQATGDPSANGGPSLDLGSGPGQPHTVQGPPFIFTATLTDNQGAVEDDPSGDGHTLRVVGVQDGDGVDVTSSFVPGRTTPLEGVYIDFVPPQVAAGAAVAVGGSAFAAGTWFSAGEFGVTNATETGAGGMTAGFEVDDADESAPLTGVESIADLPEGRSNRFNARVVSLRDVVGNQTPSADFPPTSPAFGVDRTALTISDVLPASPIVFNPNDDAGDGALDNNLSFAASDPRLASGVAASGYGTATGSATASDGSTISITPSIAPNATGTNTITMAGMAETTWTVNVTAGDASSPPNQATFGYTVTVDRTDPLISVVNPPPGSVNTGGTITFVIQGSITDANGLSEAFVRVRNADDNTADTCESDDAFFTVGSGPGQVSQAEVDILGSAGDFEVQIQAHSNGSGTQQDFCFFIDAADTAKDRSGTAEPNRSSRFIRTLVNWS